MANMWIEDVKKTFYIAQKDVRIYFLKAPNITFGLLLPLVLYLSFSIGRTVQLTSAIPGLVAMAAFFGAGAIQAVSLPLERRTGTINILLAAPTSFFTIVLGKTLAGFFFGIVLSLAYTGLMLPFSSIPNLLLFSIGILFSSLMFSAFGLFLSAPFQDIPDAMPPATVVRIALVFICGVFIPIETMRVPLQAIAYLLPLTYSVNALRQAMSDSPNIQMFLVDLVVQIFYSIVFLVVTTQVLKKTVS